MNISSTVSPEKMYHYGLAKIAVIRLYPSSLTISFSKLRADWWSVARDFCWRIFDVNYILILNRFLVQVARHIMVTLICVYQGLRLLGPANIGSTARLYIGKVGIGNNTQVSWLIYTVDGLTMLLLFTAYYTYIA